MSNGHITVLNKNNKLIPSLTLQLICQQQMSALIGLYGVWKELFLVKVVAMKKTIATIIHLHSLLAIMFWESSNTFFSACVYLHQGEQCCGAFLGLHAQESVRAKRSFLISGTLTVRKNETFQSTELQTKEDKPASLHFTFSEHVCFSLSSTFTKFFFTLLGLHIPPSLAGGGGRLAQSDGTLLKSFPNSCNGVCRGWGTWRIY